MRRVLAVLLGVSGSGCARLDDGGTGASTPSGSGANATTAVTSGGALPVDPCASYVACAEAPEETAAPRLVLGTGKACFAPIVDEVPLVSGPQGGYHVWVAVQTSGLGPAPTLSLRLLGPSGPLGLADPMVRGIDTCPVANGWRETAHLFGFVAASDPNVAEALVGTEANLVGSLDDGAQAAAASQPFVFGAIDIDAHHGGG